MEGPAFMLSEAGIALSTGFECCVWEEHLCQTERAQEQGSLSEEGRCKGRSAGFPEMLLLILDNI